MKLEVIGTPTQHECRDCGGTMVRAKEKREFTHEGELLFFDHGGVHCPDCGGISYTSADIEKANSIIAQFVEYVEAKHRFMRAPRNWRWSYEPE